MPSSPEFKARLRTLRESILAHHVAELAGAEFFRRLMLRWQIATEYRREHRKIEPSPHSLYISIFRREFDKWKTQDVALGCHVSGFQPGWGSHLTNNDQPLSDSHRHGRAFSGGRDASLHVGKDA